MFVEGGRVIGFILEHVRAQHAAIEDLPACETVVERMHCIWRPTWGFE